MHLQRRLRRQDDARAARDVDGLAQFVAAEDSGSGTDQDQIRGSIHVDRGTDAERRLGVAVREDGAFAAPLERQLEAAADCSSNSSR
jgi:hypothetical protein